MTTRTLYLVRHGDTTATEAGVVAGFHDVELTDKGRRAVRSAAQSLQPLMADGQAMSWIASPLSRTRETADILRQATAQESTRLQLDDRLIELNFGDWEGMSWSDVHQEYADDMAHWSADWVNRAPPGGETFQMHVDRCRAWLQDWLQNDTAASTTIVVSHGGSIRALLCILLSQPQSMAMRFTVEPASVCRIDWHASADSWRAVTLNSRQFL